MKLSGFTLMLWCLLFSAARAEVSMVTSIEPLALIGKAIVGDHGSVNSLVDPRQSPHEYSMRPSDRIAIQQANLLVWVDPAFELYLTDIFNAQSRNKKLITFSSLQNMVLAYEASGELDPHMWLNTRNAAILGDAIATAAGELDREYAPYFQENLARFNESLLAVERDIVSNFAGNDRNTYAVYHNAYRYFEDQFGLQHSIVLLRNPEVQPNVQEIMQVRNSVQELNPKCLLTEFDSNPAIIDTMLGGAEMEMPVIDTLGYSVTSDANGYVTLLGNLAQQFKECIN